MKRLFIILAVLFGLITLTGCPTPEGQPPRKKNQKPTTDIVFVKDVQVRLGHKDLVLVEITTKDDNKKWYRARIDYLNDFSFVSGRTHRLSHQNGFLVSVEVEK